MPDTSEFMRENSEQLRRDRDAGNPDMLEAENLRQRPRAVEDLDAASQFALASMYITGRGMARNDAEAIKLLRLSAAGNYAPAQFGLGAMYEAGRGVEQDDKQAFEWFEKAANQGNADAQFAMAVRSSQGRGVSQDQLKALDWLQKAADQGHAGAKQMLAPESGPVASAPEQ